jgi:hypothetical protein|tara:strand:+ start:1471 stop:1911 length:441 start_codon:yes stop_codon:yes gene_type:complete
MSKVFTVDDIQEVTKAASMFSVNSVWCTILFKGCQNSVPFYASEEIGDDFQRDMYVRLKAGEFGELAENGVGLWYITIPPSQAELEEAALLKRTQLLVESDYTEFPSIQEKMTAEKIVEWGTYRQALRDITKQQSYPWDPQWPTKP